MVVNGVLGIDGSVPLRVLNGPSLVNLALIPCHITSSGDYYPPPLVSPLASKLGSSVSNALLSCLASSQDTLVTLAEVGGYGPTLTGVSIGLLSPTFAPQVSPSTNPTLFFTLSISINSSSDDNRVHYTLRNRSIIKEVCSMGGEDAQGGVAWGLFLVLHFMEKVEVESLTFSWPKIGLGFIWPWVGNIPSNGHLEKSSPKGRLPHENVVLQLSWVDKHVKKIVLKEIGGFNFSEGYFSIRNLRFQ
jgi:hypothetical protein